MQWNYDSILVLESWGSRTWTAYCELFCELCLRQFSLSTYLIFQFVWPASLHRLSKLIYMISFVVCFFFCWCFFLCVCVVLFFVGQLQPYLQWWIWPRNKALHGSAEWERNFFWTHWGPANLYQDPECPGSCTCFLAWLELDIYNAEASRNESTLWYKQLCSIMFHLLFQRKLLTV